jgi:hypothetical protein
MAAGGLERTITNLKTRGTIRIFSPIKESPSDRYLPRKPLTVLERTQVVWRALRYTEYADIDIRGGTIFVSRPYIEGLEARQDTEVYEPQSFISQPLEQNQPRAMDPIAA